MRHLKDGESYHLLPGGGVEVGESVGAALAREVREETGLVCEIATPLFINDSIAPDGSRHVVQLTFLARIIGGSLSESTDPRVAEATVVGIAALQGLDLRPPMTEALLDAMAADYEGQARYLGPLWSDQHGITGAGASPAADG